MFRIDDSLSCGVPVVKRQLRQTAHFFDEIDELAWTFQNVVNIDDKRADHR